MPSSAKKRRVCHLQGLCGKHRVHRKGFLNLGQVCVGPADKGIDPEGNRREARSVNDIYNLLVDRFCGHCLACIVVTHIIN